MTLVVVCESHLFDACIGNISSGFISSFGSVVWQAFVEFVNEETAARAMQLHREPMGSVSSSLFFVLLFVIIIIFLLFLHGCII